MAILDSILHSPLFWGLGALYVFVRIDEWRFQRAQQLTRQLMLRRRMAWCTWGLIAIATMLVLSLRGAS